MHLYTIFKVFGVTQPGIELRPYRNFKKQVKWVQPLHKACDILLQFFSFI